MLSLPSAVALLEQGITDGFHLGAQLSVSHRGDSADLAVGNVDVDTPFPWFSQTKALTAVALAQQWERGEVALDDPVAAHIPEFAKEHITVRHLLTHTAGLRNAELAATETDGADWDASVQRACEAGVHDDWVPGRRAGYNPKGAFQLLGEIVRLIDGRSFDEYVRDEVFRPLDMERSSLRATESGVVYDTSGESPRALGGPPPDVRPSSSGVGPASDLLRFWEALCRGGRPVLSPQAVEAMTARHRVGLRDETFGPVIDWGLGLMVNSWQYQQRPTPYGYGDRASPRAFGHGGSQSSIGFVDPEHGLVVVLLTNGMPGEKGNHRRTQPVLTALYEDLAL
ncbi:MAG TPA: serine hydrolase domain-containing protein [Acidimicrobiales bacterium]|nr:serine hydrolase domain-containing protein [Acidimicrobiales bacterium]